MAALKLSAEHKAELTAAFPTIDWTKLFDLLQKAPAILALLQQLITLFGSGAKMKAAATTCPPAVDGCCDHKACCEACLASALQTAYLCAEHCAQCEECEE